MTDHRYMRFGGDLTRGTKFDESLPNIKGGMGNFASGIGGSGDAGYGCISAPYGSSNNFGSTGTYHAWRYLSFDAHNSNSIYNDNSEIIPRSQVFVPIIKY